MAKKNNDEGIKAIAEALRAGGTLLSAACPICDSPLIKINDKIYCKVCNKEVMIYKDEKDLPKEVQKALQRENKYANNASDNKLEQTIKNKIESLRKKLEETDDPDEIMKVSEAIDKLHSTLTKMQNEN